MARRWAATSAETRRLPSSAGSPAGRVVRDVAVYARSCERTKPDHVGPRGAAACSVLCPSLRAAAA